MWYNAADLTSAFLCHNKKYSYLHRAVLFGLFGVLILLKTAKYARHRFGIHIGIQFA